MVALYPRKLFKETLLGFHLSCHQAFVRNVHKSSGKPRKVTSKVSGNRCYCFDSGLKVLEFLSFSPSLRYDLLLEYRRRNAGNIPRNVQEQCAAVSKEVRNVILFPKEAKGVVNQKKQG